MSEPWCRERENKCNTEDATKLREVVSKLIWSPAYLGVAALVYMQMFRQQYNNRNKYM